MDEKAQNFSIFTSKVRFRSRRLGSGLSHIAASGVGYRDIVATKASRQRRWNGMELSKAHLGVLPLACVDQKGLISHAPTFFRIHH